MGKRPEIMGILNVTPDSFYSGGRWDSANQAVDAALRMRDQGADWIDVGGESTRPGAQPVTLDDELTRALPVVEALVSHGVEVSIDTTKPEVALAALDLGAGWVNDVSGLRNPEMVDLVVDRQPRVCIMHMLGNPATMQQQPTYGDVVTEVWSELLDTAKKLRERGLPRKNIYLDPGIGFGKTLDHNLSLLKHLPRDLEFPILLGVSRKSFIGDVLGQGGERLATEERLIGTLATQVVAQLAGVACLRVHDVAEAAQCRLMVEAILSAQ